MSSLIPKNENCHDDFFTEAGRAVLLAALKKRKALDELDIEDMVSDLMMKSSLELYEELEETEAKIYLDPKGERTTVSIRATIANCVRHFSALKNTTSPFSIRDWVLSTPSSDQSLFITCQVDQRKALHALRSVWISVALHAIKQRTKAQAKQTLWVIIDELHVLQKLEPLEGALAELRKYGGALVLASQNISQLDKLYGHHGSRAILDQCGTKVSFRQSDPDIAKRMASFFGNREFQETKEGLSYGAHEMRDGVSLSTIERKKPLISSTQIMNLPDLEAFVKLPGNWPALKAKCRYFKQSDLSESYVPK